MTAWVVVVEAQAIDGDGLVEISQLRRLLEHMSGVEPIGLHSAERVAVQVHIDAPDEAEALRLALSDLRAGLPVVGLWDLRVVRAEVLASDEFERDCRLAYGEGSPGASAHQADEEGAERIGEQLLRQAFQDPLTQLLSRGFFINRLEWALLPPPDGVVEEQAVVVLNLSGMTRVNDRWGRSAGDEVLAASGRRLNAALPPGQIAGRIGGDEFAVLLGDTSRAEAEAVTSRLLRALSEPVPIGGIGVATSARAGIAMSRPGHHAGDLLAEARAAAHAAREQSKRIELFHPGGAAVDSPRLRAAVVHEPMGYLLLMQRAAMAANESGNLEQAASLVVSQVCAHVEFQLGHLYAVSGAGLLPARLARPRPKEYEGLLDFLGNLTLGPGEGLAGRVLASGKPAWITDIASAGALPWSAAARACGFNAALAFPVIVNREVVAVLEFFAEHSRVPDDELVEVLRCIGSQLGRVVERQRASMPRAAGGPSLRRLTRRSSGRAFKPRQLG